MKKNIYIVIIFLVFIVGAAFVSREPILKAVTSGFLDEQLNAKTQIDNADINLIKSTITESGITISAERGLDCSIGEVNIHYGDIVKLLGGKRFVFRFEDLEFSYPGSKVLNGIANALSLELEDMLQFDYVNGELIRGKNEVIIRSLEAQSKRLKLFVDATIADNNKIDCSIRMLLSKEMIANIPESIRKVFFKQDGEYSEVTLYIAGSIDKPSINFSTDLFKFVVK